MPAKVHDSFRISNAKQFKESFHELAEHKVGMFVNTDALVANTTSGGYDLPASGISSTGDLVPSSALDDNIYLFIGRVTPWTEMDLPKHIKDRTIMGGVADPNINENDPPYPIDSVKYGNYDHWDDMIAAKKVNGNDVSHVIERERPLKIQAGQRGWTAGNQYDQYDDRAEGLYDDDMMMHTINEQFRVFKCMKMGLGVFANTAGGHVWDHKSYDEPQNTNTSGSVISEDFMQVGGDGYQWKYLYTISAGEALKFVTTSYIPVRTIRQTNGDRPNDFTDQYDVESSAIDGAILSVHVDKNQVVDSSTILGYEPVGGDGYIQFAADSTTSTMTMNLDSGTGAFTIVIPLADLVADCQYPEKTCAQHIVGASTALNNFNIGAGTIFSDIIDDGSGASGLAGYGLRITNVAASLIDPAVQDYVFPIASSSYSGTDLTLTMDAPFVTDVANTAILSGTYSGAVSFEVNPRIEIDANFGSSSAISGERDKALQAYAIVEPLFDASTPATKVYKNTEPGRVIDVKVLRPGSGHTRIDETRVMPDVAATLSANTAVVHACVAPVGGHGFDPVAELGGYNVMINARFEGSESDEFSVGNEFRKIGILKNPVTQAASNAWISRYAYDEYFSGQKSDQCYRVSLANVAYDEANTLAPLNFEPDMPVSFYLDTDTTLSNPIASATIVDYDSGLKRIRVCRPRKDFAQVLAAGTADSIVIKSDKLHSIASSNVVANNSGTYTLPGMKAGSGQILYMENRSIVSRSSNQVEDLKISISF